MFIIMTQYSKKNNINLEQNGRIFPNWIMDNFKHYILPEIIRKEGEDPCNEKLGEKLTLYQEFIGQYLNYQSPFKDILLYHGVGSGKTNTAINVYNILFNYTPKWNIFLLIPASLHDDPWLKDLQKWMSKEDYEKRFANIVFIHYDSPYADRDFLEKVKMADASKTSLFIIDEVHKFINNVYNNITTQNGKRAQVIYDYITQEKKENSNVRIMLLSATPVVNKPFEFALIFNLLRPDIFPTSETIFHQIFVSSSNFEALNENTKNMFQRRILGLVSYYIGATPDKYAQKTVHYINIPMEEYHQKIYEYFEEIEEKKEKLRIKFRGKMNDKNSTYSSYTRQACNFVFPNISDKINGEGRPRPGQFRVSEYDAIIIDEGKNIEKKQHLIKDKQNVLEYLKAIRNYTNSFIEYVRDIFKEDKKINYSIVDDVKLFLNTFHGDFDTFYKDKKKSNLFKILYKCSPKYIRIIFNILKIKGTVMIYSNYVETEGLQLLKVYFSLFGFVSYDDKEKVNDKDTFRYCEFHGGIDKNIRKINKQIFNNSDNKYGKNIKIIMISPAGAEGINLNNVRQVHILEPYWNEVRIEQVIGRALRFCQHKDLPMEERKVDVFRYKMIRNSGVITSDENLETIARKKNNLLLSFTEAVKEAAIDCELFKAHNMIGSKYKCFQFNEDSLFENPPSGAYNNKIEYDIKLDNGLNAKDSNIKKIRVRKIIAVIMQNESTYSNENTYWMCDETGIVYDYDLDYPIGKILKDDNDNFNMLEKNVYIISNIISIPKIELYN